MNKRNHNPHDERIYLPFSNDQDFSADNLLKATTSDKA